MTYAFFDITVHIYTCKLINHTMQNLSMKTTRKDDLPSEDIRELKHTLPLLKTQIVLMETNIESHETPDQHLL